MTKNIYSTRGLTKVYGEGRSAVHALRGVNLEIPEGEIAVLLGPSGSGKSTLLNIIGGLEEPSRGHVIVDGENVVVLSEDQLSEMRLTKMGFVFQSYNLLANFTARENVEVPMALAGLNRRERRRRVEHLLESVSLADRAKHYPSELSGGQQQRVAIARALANDPPILIGDEITVVGELELFADACMSLGPELTDDELLDDPIESGRIVVSRSKLKNRHIHPTDITTQYRCFLTRLQRIGVGVATGGEVEIEPDDVLHVTGPRSLLDRLSADLGHLERTVFVGLGLRLSQNRSEQDLLIS